jgi:hypothetical protein
VSPYAYEFELRASIRIHRVQPVSLLDEVVEDPLVGQRVEPPHQWKLMEKKRIKYPVLRIVGYIETSYSILLGRRVMIPLLENLQSSLMDYKQWRSVINDILGSPDHRRMLSEDLEPKGGILSLC